MTALTTDYVPGTPRIAFDHCGAGPLLIFLHGIGGNRTNWHDQLPVFGQHFHAVSWDARGYGASDDYDGPLHFGEFAKDLGSVIRFFNGKRAHLVGLSMGGLIALDFTEVSRITSQHLLFAIRCLALDIWTITSAASSCVSANSRYWKARNLRTLHRWSRARSSELRLEPDRSNAWSPA